VGSLFNLTGAAATRDAQRVAVTESRLHIPLIFGQDVIHGYRTIFPIPLGEAASWDPEAVEAAAHVAAKEAAAAGCTGLSRPWWTSRAIRGGAGSRKARERIPTWVGDGRRARPRLSGRRLACSGRRARHGQAFCRLRRRRGRPGLQHRRPIGATLREVYLPPYRAALDAGAATVMTFVQRDRASQYRQPLAHDFAAAPRMGVPGNSW